MPKTKSWYAQKFSHAWQNDPEFKGWLAPMQNNVNKAFCKLCKAELNTHKNDLRKHASTVKHKSKVAENANLMMTTPITQSFRPVVAESRKIAEIRSAVFIAKHTAFNSVDHLMLLLPSIFPDSTIAANLRMQRTKCTGLIVNLISPCLFQELIDDIGDSFYSLIIDESTDVSQKKMLAICIRYYSASRQAIRTTFLKMLNLGASGTSDAIGAAVKTTLEQAGLRLEKLIGIGVDGCSTMVGVNHSVSTYFKALVPEIVMFKCVCHSLQLAANKAAEAMPAHIDFLVRESYSWFSHSTKRLLHFRELHKTITNEVPNKLLQLSATRWMSRYECIRRIIDQWDSLKLCFTMASSGEEKCYTARQLAKMYEDPTNYVYLIFLEGILKDFSRINKLFELAEADVVRLGTDLGDFFFSLLQRIVIPNKLEKVSRNSLFNYDFRKDLMPLSCVYFGYAFGSNVERLQIGKEEGNEVKGRCMDFLIKATEEVQSRLPENAAVFRAMTSISPKEIHRIHEVTTLAERFRNITPDVDAVNNELRQIKLISVPEDLNDNPVKFWSYFEQYKDAAGEPKFANIARLAIALYSLPYSNAEVERIFSKMNNFKSKLRNKMASPTTDALIRIDSSLKWRGEECHNFKVTNEMKKKFNAETVYKVNAEDDFMFQEDKS
eukprot:gene15248-16822_t